LQITLKRLPERAAFFIHQIVSTKASVTHFKQGRGAHAAADTHGFDTIFCSALSHIAQQRGA
jgi:hypothetical protein